MPASPDLLTPDPRLADQVPLATDRLADSGITYRRVGIRPDGTSTTDYLAGWALQRRIFDQVAADESDAGTVLFVEHDPVYTAGRRTNPADRPIDGSPVIDIDRGGDITYHGPGQLVGYPIVRLPKHGLAVGDFVRRLEEAIIRSLADLGITAGRVPHRTGVWIARDHRGPERKICAIGIRIARKICMHGFALNVDPDMSYFDRIVPCGITDAGVTSIARELGSAPSLYEVSNLIQPHLDDMLRYRPFTKSPDVGVMHAYNPQDAHGVVTRLA